MINRITPMSTLTEEELAQIRKEVEEAFPADPALQQVHIARKTLAKEAANLGIGFLDYIKSLSKSKSQKAQ